MDSERLERLENYLNDQLSDSEIVQLEQDLENDLSLQEDLDFLKATLDAVHSNEVKIKLDTIHDDLYGDKQGTPINKRWIYYAMAAAISIIIISVFLFSQPVSPEGLYEEYYEVYPNFLSSRSSSLTDVTFQGLQHYDNENYQQAIAAFTDQINKEGFNENVYFYLALSYLNEGNSSEAIQIFTQKLKANIKFEQQINWYLAMAYLKNNEMDKALTQLKSIKPDEYNYQKASAILNALNN